MDALPLSGGAAIVTGGASGIGLAFARALAQRGVDLALADVDAAGLESARAELTADVSLQSSRVTGLCMARSFSTARSASGPS